LFELKKNKSRARRFTLFNSCYNHAVIQKINQVITRRSKRMDKLNKIPVNLSDAGDDLVLHAAMPGAEPENILVTFTAKAIVLDSTARGTLARDKKILRQEWGIGKYHRMLRLPCTVDTMRVNVTYDNGVLTVSMPKGIEMTPREIRVKKLKGPRGQTRGHSGRAG